MMNSKMLLKHDNIHENNMNYALKSLKNKKLDT